MQQQIKSQPTDTSDIHTKVKELQESKIPKFVKFNKEAEKKLVDLENIFQQYEKEFEGVSDEQKKTLLDEKPANKNLAEIYKRGNVAKNILKNRDKYHCFCEVRERAQREQSGKPPTDWEFIEFLYSTKSKTQN